MRHPIRCYVWVAWLLVGNAAGAQTEAPPTITTTSIERTVSADAGADAVCDPGIDKTSSAEEGWWPASAIVSCTGRYGSRGAGSVEQLTQISSFSISGTGSVQSDAMLGSDENAWVVVNVYSLVQVSFTVSADAPFELKGDFAVTELDLNATCGTDTGTWVFFSGTDTNGANILLNQRFNCQSPADDATFHLPGTLQADTPVTLLVMALSGLGTELDVPGFGQRTASFDFSFDLGDRDGDGLLNIWEEQGGINVDADPDLEIDLSGADPDRKDLFVEVDVMQGSEHSDGAVEEWAEILDVQNAFAVAPGSLVRNPVPQAGNISEPTIKLHVRYGGHSPANQALTSAGKWPDQFDGIKNANFGLPAERARADWESAFKPTLMMVYRYCLWADTLVLEGTPGSGVAERPGNDLVVASGFVKRQYELQLNEEPLPADLLIDALAGTFMHELGHNLGLQHGGRDDLLFKPNYISVMSYTYQIPWYVQTNQGTNAWSVWELDYSRKKAAPVDEEHLFESLPPAGTPGRQMIFNSNPDTSPGSAVNIATANATTIDWNFSQGPPDPAEYPLDVSRIDWNVDEGNHILISYTDWDRLWYHLSGMVDFEDGVGRNLDAIQLNIDPDTIDSIMNAEWIDQTVLTEEFFLDDFELGDKSAWSKTVP